MTSDEGYARFRGKCQEMANAAAAADPTLTVVRGWYACPIWGREEPHWWTTRPDGSIYDPTAEQFPSNGMGLYTAFNGMLACEECGKEIPEAEAIVCGNGHYAVCSNRCYAYLVGVPC